ncbi:MAG: hypothetical protein R6U32_00680 [Candidatus Woesearchaeota archaeon]
MNLTEEVRDFVERPDMLTFAIALMITILWWVWAMQKVFLG